MLVDERQKLRDTDSLTILDYVKTSLEILMNMKMEERDFHKSEANLKRKDKKGKNKGDWKGKQSSLNSSQVMMSET